MEGVENLQDDLILLAEWLWKVRHHEVLTFNIKPCTYGIMKKQNMWWQAILKLKLKTLEKDLSLLVDEWLNFKEYIDRITARVNHVWYEELLMQM